MCKLLTYFLMRPSPNSGSASCIWTHSSRHGCLGTGCSSRSSSIAAEHQQLHASSTCPSKESVFCDVGSPSVASGVTCMPQSGDGDATQVICWLSLCSPIHRYNLCCLSLITCSAGYQPVGRFGTAYTPAVRGAPPPPESRGPTAAGIGHQSAHPAHQRSLRVGGVCQCHRGCLPGSQSTVVHSQVAAARPWSGWRGR